MPTSYNELKRNLILSILKKLCRIFWGPDLKLCQDILNGNFTHLLNDISAAFEIDLSTAISETDRLANEYHGADALHAALSNGYIALFVNDIKGISAPLYHSCYQMMDCRLMGPPAIDMKNRMARHGLSLCLSANEPEDHLSIELEYLYFLLSKGWSESCTDLIREAVLFAADSMIGWVCRLYAQIMADGRFSFYATAAQLLFSIVRILEQPSEFIQPDASNVVTTTQLYCY